MGRGECHHCPNVHKAFTAGVVTPGGATASPPRLHHPPHRAGPAPERSAHTRGAGSNDYAAFFTWPVSSIQCYPGRALSTFRWVPVAVDRTLLIRERWLGNWASPALSPVATVTPD